MQNFKTLFLIAILGSILFYSCKKDDPATGYAAIKASVVDPVTYTNKRMPQGGILSENDINTIVKWFNKGGKSTD